MRKLVLVGAIALLVGCAGKNPPRVQYPEPLPEGPSPGVIAIQTEPLPVAAQMAGQTGVVELHVLDRGFEPAVITVKKGDRVKLYVKNESKRAQNLIVERFQIYSRELQPGDENYVEFTANEKGDWSFVSDVGSEGEPRLVGSLKVE